MRIRVFAILVALAVATSTALPAAGAQAPRASLGSFVCQPSANQLNRAIGVTATIRPLPGTQAMELRFQLLERLPGQGAHLVQGGDLGHWRHPASPGLGSHPGDTWVVNKPVANLYAPAAYRFRVSFRWLGRLSHVIALQTRVTPVCEQPG